jgi:hypothetical protein
VTVGIAVDANDVESSGIPGVCAPARQKQLGGQCEFSLLVVIDRQGGPSEASGRAKSNFDENEAVPIEHDQVNLAVAATEVSRYGSQTFIFQKSECELLGMIP